LQGVGGSIGLTRLFEVLKKRLPKTVRTVAAVYIICRNDLEKLGTFQRRAIEMAARLREHNVKVDVQPDLSKRMKEVFSYASQKGYPYVISIMDDHSVVVKNMVTEQQTDFPDDAAAEAFFLHSVE
jgi:histidyl-tRNA synthetase